MKWILIILMLPVAGCSQFQFVKVESPWQDIKDAFNPTLPRDHWGKSTPWELASRDRSLGIHLHPSHYGIWTDPDINRARFFNSKHWDEVMIWDPILKKYRTYRSRTEYLNDIR